MKKKALTAVALAVMAPAWAAGQLATAPPVAAVADVSAAATELAVAAEPAEPAVSVEPADLAESEVSAERGKELFESTRLGTNHKSCATCHLNGNKLDRAASYQEARLKKIVNMCIKQMLAGKPLPADSSDLAALISYLRSLAQR